MKPKSSAGKWITGLCLGEALFVWVAWQGLRHETEAVNRTVSEASELKDPSPFRAALMGHLGKIHLGLEGYLRSPGPSMEKQIAESRQDFEALLPEFAKQNPKLFPPKAGDEIGRTFGQYKEAIDRTLEANARRMQRRGILEKNFAQILYHIDSHLRPIIRKEQADGAERADAILNIENQMRAWQQNLALAWAQPSEAASALTYENENRGETYLELYAGMDLLARERKVLHEIRTLWQSNSDLARESFVNENLVAQTEKMMNAQREQVVATLNKLLPALPPAEMEAKKNQILSAMRLHLAAAGGIGLLGLVSLLVAVLGSYRLALRRAPVADGIYRTPPAEAAEARLQMDLKGMITDWTPGAEALYGYGAAEMLNQSIGTLFESESEITRLGREVQKAKRATFETTHKTKAGAALPVRIEFHPVADASGHATAISLVCTPR